MPRIKRGARQLTYEKTTRARELRKSASASEEILWNLIRQNKTGFKFRRQNAIGPYILDFYCAEAKLCVEVDGEQHEERKEKDGRRDAYLSRLGVLTIRVPSLDLFEETHTESSRWVNKIVAICEERSGRKAWEGR